MGERNLARPPPPGRPNAHCGSAASSEGPSSSCCSARIDSACLSVLTLTPLPPPLNNSGARGRRRPGALRLPPEGRPRERFVGFREGYFTSPVSFLQTIDFCCVPEDGARSSWPGSCPAHRFSRGSPRPGLREACASWRAGGCGLSTATARVPDFGWSNGAGTPGLTGSRTGLCPRTIHGRAGLGFSATPRWANDKLTEQQLPLPAPRRRGAGTGLAALLGQPDGAGGWVQRGRTV